MTGQVHGLALRAPWYACGRAGFDRFDPRSFAPSIQKYDTDDFVQRVVADPRDSLVFDPGEDVWSFAVPRVKSDKPTLRDLLSPFVLARSGVRKLYQPSHHRFYAITVELFCEAPGLPRPAQAGPVEVKFVVRRMRTTFAHPGTNGKDLKDLARAAATDLFCHGFPPPDPPPPHPPPPGPPPDHYPPNDPSLDTAQDLVALYGLNGPDAAKLAAFQAKHADLIKKIDITQVLEGWYAPAGGRGDWQPVPLKPSDPVPADPEQELPMWRIPASAAGCLPAQTRSLWFGVIPTYSGEFDLGNRPKLDDHTTYVLQCVARRSQPPPRQSCPRIVTWSGPSVPYRLAAFFDPSGTANRRIHVRLPDFAALAARAGDGPSGGGVEFERPAGSQLPAGPRGQIPGPGSGTPGGDSAETCSFAIELITIVATFVLSLFLPIVVFAFQLWWMLLLKFCWPPTQAVNNLLSTLQSTPINSLTDTPPDHLDKQTFLDLLGVQDDVRAELFKPDPGGIKTDKQLGQDLVNAVQPAAPPTPAAVVPLPPVTDPLCRRPQK